MNVKLSKKLIGKIVYLEFLDHALMTEPVKCKAVGFLEKFSRNYLTLTYWDLFECPKDVRNFNKESYTIVRSTITKFEILN